MSMKTLADYIRWRNKEPIRAPVEEWRPPVPPINYDKPQTDVFSKLDKDPIIRRILINPKIAPPRAFPILGSPAYQFFAGLWTGAMLTFVFTSKPLGRKEVEDLVKYDPAYFPEYAKAH
ncbi:hypothetical protein PLESTB_000551600 [Pleodorina starrii]|uniref:Uncharacterized protein n=1 Tax=Pleodorina starrii TaxID=330485 RepID=A0A9W6BHQ8_9CHLO|nr:hypothetical protein PLESTM_000276800 [Pleodorina starrii]GLC51817.1 hypothetical protein PLESTB_000551600 [Pleodorina starrii]GLC69530.1 hypothetical protein PLESTF_000842200 [Pleodorina starrii]